MFRRFALLAIGIVVAALAGRGAAEPPVVAPGDETRGDLTEENKLTTNYGYTGQLANGKTYFVNSRNSGRYGTEYSIPLKAGQDLRATATVVGKDRGVLLTLIDPSGKPVDGTDLRPKTAEVTFDEVSATGKYRLLVASDRIGDYALRLSGTSDRELEVRTLERRIAWLKRDINETEALLKALRAKKAP